MTQPIKKFLKKCLPKQHAWKMKLLENWSIIMGTLAKSIYIQKIQGSQLTMSAPHSSWVAELHAMSCTIIARINQTLGNQYVDRLRCIVRGNGSMKKEMQKSANHSVPENNNTICSIPKQFEKHLEGIADPEMQNALKTYWMRCVKGKAHEAHKNHCHHDRKHCDNNKHSGCS